MTVVLRTLIERWVGWWWVFNTRLAFIKEGQTGAACILSTLLI